MTRELSLSCTKHTGRKEKELGSDPVPEPALPCSCPQGPRPMGPLSVLMGGILLTPWTKRSAEKCSKEPEKIKFSPWTSVYVMGRTPGLALGDLHGHFLIIMMRRSPKRTSRYLEGERSKTLCLHQTTFALPTQHLAAVC